MQINVRMTLAADGREWSRTYDIQLEAKDGISQPDLLSEVDEALSKQLNGLRQDAEMVTEKNLGDDLPTPDELPIGQLEDRYYVIKRNHLSEDEERQFLAFLGLLRIRPIQDAAVVESDWSCYDKVVSLILTENANQGSKDRG